MKSKIYFWISRIARFVFKYIKIRWLHTLESRLYIRSVMASNLSMQEKHNKLDRFLFQ